MRLETIKSLLNNNGFKRFVIFGIIVLALYLSRSMINLILITFIFSFLMDRLVKLVLSRFKLNRKLTVVTLYIGIIGLLSIGIIKYLPLIVNEISSNCSNNLIRHDLNDVHPSTQTWMKEQLIANELLN